MNRAQLKAAVGARVTRAHLAWTLVAVGILLVFAGVWWIWPPAALIAAGVGLLAAGLVGIDLDGRRSSS